MKEELLHFVWQAKLLVKNELHLITGEKIDVISRGLYNRDAGPDFFNARIRIGDTTWAGNIEFHVMSSDWLLHKHQFDKAYNNVILHVVYHHDREITYPDGKTVPTLELKGHLPPLLLKRYAYLQKNQAAIPCEPIFRLPEKERLQLWMQRLLVERLERKTEYFAELLARNAGDWERAFYIFTARYFGMKTNAVPFEWLAERIPLQVIAKYKDSQKRLRALCFGVAGFLEEGAIADLIPLKQEFLFLKEKHGLVPMDESVWKFGRTRPANFPTRRIAQFADLLFRSSHLLSKVVEAKNLGELFILYEGDDASKSSLSRDAVTLLLLNAVLPVTFLYGRHHYHPDLQELVLGYYELLEAENNHITRFWKTHGIRAENASASQALIEMKTRYCDEIRCLDCIIGQNILINE